LREFRRLILEEPEIAEREKVFTDALATGQKIPKGGGRIKDIPDISKHPYLDAGVPDFSEIHDGFRYETAALKVLFYGPEKHMLDDGGYMEIKPPEEHQD